ncbi:MAG: SCO family protein [Kofleriaceae bacterium]|nr:SCO family protein [Kofleriaceae bacterium]
MSSSGIPGKKLLLGLLTVFVVATVPTIIIPTLACRQNAYDLPDLGTVPAFSLIDDQGQVFTEAALRGHPTIIDFVFTRCDTICPVISARMARMQEKLSDRRAEAIKLVSISVDPLHDTPEKLAAYGAKFQARPDKWRFLTGPIDSVKRLVEGPFMGLMKVEGLSPAGAPAISHSGYFMLVDGDLKIRGVYDSAELPKLEEMMRHARYLARTASGTYKFGGS